MKKNLCFPVLILAFCVLFLVGCGANSWFCQNKSALQSTFNLAQAGYHDYVSLSQQGSVPANDHLVLADQVLSIAGPFIQGAASNACPPDAVVETAQAKINLMVATPPTGKK